MDDTNSVPNGWSIQPLGGNIDILSGFPFKSEQFTDDNSKIGLIRIRDLVKQNLVTFYEGDFDELFVVTKGDVLIGMDGDFNIVKWKTSNALLNQRICKIQAIETSEFSTDFLFHSLASDLQEIHATTGATTVKHLSVKDLRGIVKPYPPLPEQKKIAAILSSVDEVIEKTQAQIDKLKNLKTGMMQELLTKGVGENGKPHTEFKDSPVGRIPVGWECPLLDDITKRGSGHTPNKKNPEYWNGGVKWISLTDSYQLDKLYISNTEKEISDLGIENSSAVLHPAGTVIMSRDAGIGKSAITTEEMAVSQHFIAWVCSSQINNFFLYYLLQYWKPRFEAIAMGSTIKTIGLPFFKKLKVPVPPLEEQHAIAITIKSVDMRIFSLQIKNSKNIATKKALMQDLLTGTVRVNVD